MGYINIKMSLTSVCYCFLSSILSSPFFHFQILLKTLTRHQRTRQTNKHQQTFQSSSWLAVLQHSSILYLFISVATNKSCFLIVTSTIGLNQVELTFYGYCYPPFCLICLILQYKWNYLILWNVQTFLPHAASPALWRPHIKHVLVE